MSENTTEQAVYHPFRIGQYRIEPGLVPLHRSLGNGEIDTKTFQFDRRYPEFRSNKEDARAEDLSKYFATDDFPQNVRRACVMHMAERLLAEYSEKFSVNESGSLVELVCATTGETLAFDHDGNLANAETLPYESAFDALASQVPEDICVVRVDDGGDKLVAAHVCAPSDWDPRKKIGRSFVEIHAPVAGIATINSKAGELMRGLCRRGAYQRFGWGLTTDNRLNHHPEPPPFFCGSLKEWRGITFDPANPSLFVRVERQTLTGLPDVGAIMFTIRVYHYDCAEFGPEDRSALRAALLSMTSATVEYKGLTQSCDDIVNWLDDTGT